MGCLAAYIDCGESIVCLATLVYLLGEMITSIAGTDPFLEPMYWLAFFVVSRTIQISGSLAFWRINRALTAATLLLVLIYIFGSIHSADFEQYALVPSVGPEAK